MDSSLQKATMPGDRRVDANLHKMSEPLGQFHYLLKFGRYLRNVLVSLPLSGFLFIIITLTQVAIAQNDTDINGPPNQSLPPGFNLSECVQPTDTYVGNAQDIFQIIQWAKRGRCVRSGPNDFTCYAILNNILEVQLNELRKAEYSGAAGVLALLPTIGALLGAPTNEIWRLLTLVPFGGVVAMFLSFGGAILPVNAKDYEIDFSRRRNGRSTTIGGLDEAYTHEDEDDADRKNESDRKKERLVFLVKQRLQQMESTHIPIAYIWYGLCGMVILLLSAHVALALCEQGAVLPWWCVSRWWMHLWYFLVTFTAITDNYVQLPFKHQWKLFVSDVPYDVQVEGGDDITDWMVNAPRPDGKLLNNHNHVEVALRQLGTMKTGKVMIAGSTERAGARNSLIVMVSVIDDNSRINSFFKAVSKLCAIGVFVTGTAFFASAQLLALPMAVMVLTLVLGAGVFGRTMAGWIVTGIEQSEPMIHFIAGTTEEAADVIQRILTIDTTADSDSEAAIDNPHYRDIPIPPTVPIAMPAPIPAKLSTFGSTTQVQDDPSERGHGPDSRSSSIQLGPLVQAPSLPPAVPVSVSLAGAELEMGYSLPKKRPSGSYRKIQVEIQGHIFVDKQRVTRRSVWPLRIMGILCKPFDLANNRLKADRRA